MNNLQGGTGKFVSTLLFDRHDKSGCIVCRC